MRALLRIAAWSTPLGKPAEGASGTERAWLGQGLLPRLPACRPRRLDTAQGLAAMRRISPLNGREDH